MAHTVTPTDLDMPDSDQPSWSGRDTSIGEVVKAIDDLRQNEQRAATRTSVATLIIVCRNTDEVDEAETVIDHLGVRHPARIITILSPADARHGEDRIDADVTMHGGLADGHQIWSDEIRLRVSGGPSRHLASLLRPMLLSDLPVVAWYVTGLPDNEDPILKVSTAIIIDSKTITDPGEGEHAVRENFEKIGILTRKNTIIDLSWNRLRPWRRLLASQFDGEVFRPYINNISRADVTGKLGPRMLLSGWLGSRLKLDRDSMHLYDGRHASIVLYAEHTDESAEFRVERKSEDHLIECGAEIRNGPAHTELVGLPDDALPLSLFDALRNIDRDRVYEHAVKLVAGWDY